MTHGQTGNVLIAAAIGRLKAADVPNSAQDARILFAHAAGIPRDRLSLLLPDPVTDDVAACFEALVTRRMAREPVSHLIGSRAFYGRAFKVTPDVLDPRPETECLITVAMAAPFTRVIDLGVGSGCILVTLLAEMPGARGIGVDQSAAALAIAAQNAQDLGVADRASFAAGDWLAGIEGTFDLIVANPPYIAADEMEGLSPEVRLFEPHQALTDGSDGLRHYRVIVAQSVDHLDAGGRLVFEIGPSQGAAVAAMMRDAGFEDVTVTPDLDGRDRVVQGQIGAKSRQTGE